MTEPNASSDIFFSIDDQDAFLDIPVLRPWNILIVDDDEQVHVVTRMLLRNFIFRQRRLRVISAKSAREAKEILEVEKDLALALIDVVMETCTAGLGLVSTIRDELKYRSIRLILRTGQAGHAPENEVVSAYEIDAYMGKTDISAQKLTTAITASLRAYDHITEIEALNTGLENQVAHRTGQLQEANTKLLQTNAELALSTALLRQLGDVGRVIAGKLSADAVFESLYQHLSKMLNASSMAIYRALPGGKLLELCFGRASGEPISGAGTSIALESSDSPIAQVARTWREALIEGNDREGTDKQATAILLVPLVVDNRLLGVTSIKSGQGDAYGERERLIIRTLCAYCAIALDNANAYQRLQQEQKKLLAQEKKLMAQEKLAELDALVVGVARELNTPLGNSLMLTSDLQMQIDALAAKLKNRNLREGDLHAFMADAQQATGLITRGLSTAVRLVNNFKQVAVDRSHAQRSVFDLRDISQEVATAMSSQIKLAGHTVELSIAKGISMNSYPEAYAEVLTQLIGNALLHAFADGVKGEIRLSAKQQEIGRVQIALQDNGAGIGEADLKRIFEAFFTTKMGQGGNGLGLCISHNIVTALLNGQISVNSKRGEGTCFTLDLPVVVPPPVR